VPSCTLLDTDRVLGEEALDAAWAYGARGIIRYVGYGVKPWGGDLELPERDRILAPVGASGKPRGFGLVVVVHPPLRLWTPSGVMGQEHGQNGSRHALAAGYLPGSSLIDDLEGIEPTASRATVDYANDKHGAVLAAGFEQAEYIGAEVPLTGSELFHWLLSCLYCRSLSFVPDIPVRGYCMEQKAGPTLAGTVFDDNRHHPDLRGGVLHWTISDDVPDPLPTTEPPPPPPQEVA